MKQCNVPKNSPMVCFQTTHSSLFKIRCQLSDVQFLFLEVCLVLLDQIDNFCRKSQSAASHLRRISHQLFHILETICDHPGVIVLATTNNVHALDPSIRRATRLEVEVRVRFSKLPCI